MNFAVIGSGGREHSICYKLKQSKRIKKLVCIPGNAGTKNFQGQELPAVPDLYANFDFSIGITSSLVP